MIRSVLRRVRILAREGNALRSLPPRVALFLVRAKRLARRSDDPFSLPSHARACDLAVLIDAAGDAREVAELGTGTAWTAIALALADPERRVVTYDPIVRPERERYLDLAGARVRKRIDLRATPAELGPDVGARYGLVFVDSSHAREETLASFRAWRFALEPGGIIAFHDYGHPDYPGVAEAIAELRLTGRVVGSMFLWRAPAADPPADPA